MAFMVKQTEIDAAVASAPPWIREMLLKFDLSVFQHAKDLSDHSKHMSKVSAQANLPVEERTHQAYPPPSVPLLIDQAVRRNDDGTFVPDFQVINDRPSTEQIVAKRLREKKSELTNRVTEEENRLNHLVFPSGYRRHYSFKASDLAVAKSKGNTLSAEDEAFLIDYKARSAKLVAIARHGAELHSQIEGLTPQNVDSWNPAPFPEVS